MKFPTIQELIDFLSSLPEETKKENLAVCDGDETWTVDGFFIVGQARHPYEGIVDLDDGNVVFSFNDMESGLYD